MSRRQLKKDVFSLLQHSSLEEYSHKLIEYQDYQLLNPLFLALCHSVELVRWHAICSFGWLVPRIVKQDLEAGRVVMRRFLWSLNDESGGIGWGAPESMAEIMCRSTRLRDEYLHMLISYMQDDGEELFQDGNYLELPMLQRGLLWGIGRLCQEHTQVMGQQQIVDDLIVYLDSSDLQVVGLAVWCLGLLGDKVGLERIQCFQDSNDRIRLFLDNIIKEIPISELVRKT